MSYKITSSKKLDTHEQEIEVTIDKKTVAAKREEAIKNIGGNLKLDGFREGKVPEKVIISRVGEASITEEAGRLALEDVYAEIVKDSKIVPFGYPKVLITKVAPEEDFGVKLVVALAPEVKLGKYNKEVAKINAEEITVEVTDAEIDTAIEDLRKQVAHAEHHKAQGPGHDHNNHDHGELPLPEVNDEFVKKFGPFASVEDFRAEVKKGLTGEKTRKESEKKKAKVIDAVVNASTFVAPQILIDRELDRMVRELEGEISRMGLGLEAYLSHINKTVEDLKKEWNKDAIKRVNTQLSFNEIATAEKLTVSEADIKTEADKIMSYYKDADRVQAESFAESVLMNEKVWKHLESIKD